MVAGPIANFLLAIVIFTAIFGIFGERITAAKVDVVNPGSVAEKAGFLAGDRVVSIDGSAIESFGEMQRIVGIDPDKPLHFVVDRGGKTVDITVTPELKTITDRFGNDHADGPARHSAERSARGVDAQSATIRSPPSSWR